MLRHIDTERSTVGGWGWGRGEAAKQRGGVLQAVVAVNFETGRSVQSGGKEALAKIQAKDDCR